MGLAEAILSQPRPDLVRSIRLPRRTGSFPSPADWRDEIIYSFLPDRQDQRPISNLGTGFALPPQGEIIAWSRVLDDEEALCLVNGHGTESRGADILVDPHLNDLQAPGDPWRGVYPFFEVIANSAEAAAGPTYAGAHPVGSHLPVQYRGGIAFVSVRDIGASEVVILNNRP